MTLAKLLMVGILATIAVTAPSAVWAADSKIPVNESEMYLPDDPTGKGEVAKEFSRSLKGTGFSGRLQSCQMIFLLQIGNGMPNQNESYGAVCKFFVAKKQTQMMICNDRMVGHLAITDSFAMTKESVAEFTRSNCYGG